MGRLDQRLRRRLWKRGLGTPRVSVSDTVHNFKRIPFSHLEGSRVHVPLSTLK